MIVYFSILLFNVLHSGKDTPYVLVILPVVVGILFRLNSCLAERVDDLLESYNDQFMGHLKLITISNAVTLIIFAGYRALEITIKGKQELHEGGWMIFLFVIAVLGATFILVQLTLNMLVFHALRRKMQIIDAHLDALSDEEDTTDSGSDPRDKPDSDIGHDKPTRASSELPSAVGRQSMSPSLAQGRQSQSPSSAQGRQSLTPSSAQGRQSLTPSFVQSRQSTSP